MANIHDCLQRAVDAGELDKIRAEEAGSNYEQLLARYETTMPRHAAEAAAAADLKEATRQARRSRHHKVVNQLQAQRRLHDLISTAEDPARALVNLLEWSEGSGFAGESVQSLADALIRDVNAELNEVLRATGRNLIGNSRDPVRLRQLIQELHLEDSGDPKAKAMADTVRGVQQRLRRMFNAHGGDIGELADFGVTHTHDVTALRRVEFQEWSEFITPLLDWTRIRNHQTGKSFSVDGRAPRPAEAQAFLRQVYDGIVTRGWNDRDPSLAVGGRLSTTPGRNIASCTSPAARPGWSTTSASAPRIPSPQWSAVCTAWRGTSPRCAFWDRTRRWGWSLPPRLPGAKLR